MTKRRRPPRLGWQIRLVGSLWMAATGSVTADTLHVSPTGTHEPPYATWHTAATDIQSAIDAAHSGDLVLVTNGTYATGSRIVESAMRNRIVIDRPITVRSVNGAESTFIVGSGPQGEPIRCAYVGADAELNGFTLSEGRTLVAGFGELLSFSANAGGGVWCERSGLVIGCVITRNRADYGGGVFEGVLKDCTLIGNEAVWYGGGSYDSSLYDCWIETNRADRGGGASGGTLNRCTLIRNEAGIGGGGGGWGGSLRNCLLIENYGGPEGGGAGSATLYNCALIRNHARNSGGGAYVCTLYNSTLTGNSVDDRSGVAGGGAYHSELYNCIVYNNRGPDWPNYYGGSFRYCCTTPLPDGPGNFTDEPDFDGDFHLAVTSPCIGAGSAVYVTGTDIDGDDWNTPPSIGCDEYSVGVGALAVAIRADTTKVTRGVELDLVGELSGEPSHYVWSFGDGTVLSNRLFVAHVWDDPGMYTVEFRAFDDRHPEGVAAAITIEVLDTPMHYVVAGNPNAVPPYDTWTTAAPTIQQAIDAVQEVAGAVVLVSNGVYATGSVVIHDRLPNRIAITKPITVRSVNGPDATFIVGGGGSIGKGGGQMRCAYVGVNAVLSGFTLREGYTRVGDLYSWPDDPDICGGAAWCERSAVISNCVITSSAALSIGGGVYGGAVVSSRLAGNRAYGGAWFSPSPWGLILLQWDAYGGGAAAANLNNCVVVENSAATNGGGVYQCLVVNCTLSANSADNGGGAYGSTLRNSVVYGNSASDDAKLNNHSGGSLVYTCTTPITDRAHNIEDPPRFLNPSLGDYRLDAASPCIDAGNTEFAPLPFDMSGEPRVRGRAVDMGAYEFFFEGHFKMFLEGPYQRDQGRMSTDLADAGLVPLTSPYAADPRTVAAIPSNVTDWVLLEVREETNSPARLTRSLLLRSDGQVVTDDGPPVVQMDLEPMRDYRVLLKHRNHLGALSAVSVPFTSRFIHYDFTGSAGQYLGGGDVAVAVEPAVWASRAGDLDGDGSIRAAVDELLYNAQAGLSGYLRADANLDGRADAFDGGWVRTHDGAASPVPRPGVSLQLSGRIDPPRRTLVEGEPLVLAASGFEGAVFWTLSENRSGAVLEPTVGETVTYQAGAAPGRVDVVQAWDSGNRLARGYFNVISPGEAASLGKAVIVAGGRDLNDPVWQATSFLADKAFRTLRYRGFAREHIRYLSFGPARDVDGDGNETNDIAAPLAVAADVQTTLTSWVSNTDRLTVYLCDHGADQAGAGQFRLNGTELIAAETLDGWLDALQDADPTLHVTVILDFCYAGSYLDELAYEGSEDRRIVVASTASDELTYFIARGQVSFSEFFWNGVLQGLSLFDCFALARDAMGTYQRAWIDDTQDGQYTPGTDGAWAETRFLGASFVAGKDFPVIGSVLENQVLIGTSAATLWADDIDSFYPLNRVWCTVIPPGYNPDSASGSPVTAVSTRELSFVPATGRYEASFDGFTQSGQYSINFFARDIWDSVSPSKQTTVVQAGFLEKVLLVGGGETSEDEWPVVRATMRQAYRTFRSRLIGGERIWVAAANALEDLDGDGQNDVDGVNTLAAVRDAAQTWADDADRLTIYLVGPAIEGEFALRESERIRPADLDGWLDHFQRTNRVANAILEFSGSGAYLPTLQAPTGMERLVVASCAGGREQVLEEHLSFSTYFFDALFHGSSLGEAVRRARKAIRRASGNLRQKALIDDTNNGIANEKNLDGVVSADRYIGSPFYTGEDLPFIVEATPETVLTNDTIVLYADGVADADGISEVWVEITTPESFAGGVSVRWDLVPDPALSRWEATYDEAAEPGIYTLTFYARDTLGNTSAGVQSRLLRTDTDQYAWIPGDQPDEFELDDSPEQATYQDLPLIQVHTLHTRDDSDRVRFFATGDQIYDIETVHLDEDSAIDTVIEVYREEIDGSLILVDTVDEFGRDEGELTGLDFPSAGYYQVRVCAAEDERFAPGTYLLVVYVPAGFDGVNVRAIDTLHGQVLPGARVSLKNAFGQVLSTAVTDGAGYTRFPGATPGVYRVEVTAPGAGGEYVRLFNPSDPDQGPDNPWSDYGNERLIGPQEFGVISYDNLVLARGTYLAFGFVPVAYVRGRVENDLTGEPVAGAAIGWVRAADGLIFSRYPWATYAKPWRSESDGAFPDPMPVPPGTVLTPRVIREGFADYTHPTPVISPARGQSLDIGALALSPTYGSNAIPDFWELRYGLPANVDGDLDPDGDAQTHRQEWVAGTDPRDGASYFQAREVVTGQGGLTLRWVGAPRRWYSVWRNDALSDPSGWVRVYGPVQNGPAYTWLEWLDGETPGRNRGHYRIEVSGP